MVFCKYVFLLYIMLLISSNSLNAQEIVSAKINYDVKIYKILLKELKAAEKVEKSEPTTSNLFRVFTTRIEILKFLKTKNVEDALNKTDSQKIQSEEKQIQDFYVRTKSIANKLEKDKKFKERPKFLLLHGLMLYDFDEKNKKIANLLGSAFVLLTDNDLKHLAASKLGDYHFNLANFKEAAKFYREALKLDPKSEWKTRHLYNLSWCFFKMENFDTAIKLLLSIYNGSKTPDERRDYYYQQSLQKIPFFYIYNNNPEEGYKFVKKNNGVASPEMLSYIKEIYNKGFFDKIDSLVIDVENNLENEKKYQALLDFQLEVYFYITSREYKKNYAMLSRFRKGVSEGDTRKLLIPEKKYKFIEESKMLLNQHLTVINRKAFDINRNLEDKLILEDAVDILRLLLTIDTDNSVSYRLKLAQLYNKTGQRDQAMKMLWDDYVKYGGVSNPEAGPYLAELLIVIDAMGSNAPTENIQRIYQDYLKVGKDQNIKKIVYLKYFDYHFNRADFKSAIALIKRHQKEFPEEKEDRKNMIVKILNQSLKQKDKSIFEAIRLHAQNDIAVNSNAQIMKSINTGHNTFLLEKVNQSLSDQSSDKANAAQKLAEIFRSNSIDRGNQLISGFNAGFIFLTIGNLASSSQIYGELIEQLSPAEYIQYHDKMTTLADNQLLLGNEDYSLQIYKNLMVANCKINKTVNANDVLKAFELLMIKNAEAPILEILSNADQCQWDTELRKKIFTLIVEYMNLDDATEGRKSLKYLSLKKVNKKEDIEKNIEAILIHSANKRSALSIQELSVLVDLVEKNWLSSISQSSEFTSELRDLLLRNSKLKPYPRERINANNFARFVTNSFDLFTANLDYFTNYRPKYQSVFHIKSMLEIATIKNFIRSFDGFETLVDDEKNKLVYVEQIKEALKPLEERIISEEGKLNTLIDAESTLLKHKTLLSNSSFYPATKPPFILDRL